MQKTIGEMLGISVAILVVVGMPFIFYPAVTAIAYTSALLLTFLCFKVVGRMMANRIIGQHHFDLDPAQQKMLKQYPFYFANPFSASFLALLFTLLKFSAIPLVIGLALTRQWVWIPLGVVCWLAAGLPIADFDPTYGLKERAKQAERGSAYRGDFEEYMSLYSDLIEKVVPSTNAKRRGGMRT